jgi:hypothetical protein
MVEPRSYCFPLSLFIDHCRKQNWKLSQRFAHRLDGEAGRKDKNVIASPGGQDSLALDIYISWSMADMLAGFLFLVTKKVAVPPFSRWQPK